MKNTTNTNDKETTPTLFFGINKHGEIVQFDKKCQNITGYHREEVLNKHIIDQLIPDAHLTQWQQLIKKITNNEPIENQQLPWKTSEGNEIMVTWNSFPLDEKNNPQQNYCLTGQLTKTPYIQKNEPTQPLHYFNPITEQKSQTNQYNKTEDTTKSDKYTNNSETVITLQNKYELLEERLKHIEKKDKALINQNTDLKETINQLTQHKTIDKQEKSTQQDHHPKRQSPISTKIKKIFGNESIEQDSDANKTEWIQQKTQELHIKEQELTEKENQIEKKILELGEWKEKLIELENEILLRYEKILQVETPIEKQPEKEPIQQITQESLEEYDHSIAILQRGIFKAINSVLSSKFGYSKDEIINKSFYDLIAPEGLADIEQFHLDRLKGKPQTHYSTVLLNKEKERISVMIKFDPIVYNEQKADLLSINITKHEILENNKQEIPKKIDPPIEEGDITQNKTPDNDLIESKTADKNVEKAEENNNNDLTKNEFKSDKKNDEKGEQ